jgi:hypothetical protein
MEARAKKVKKMRASLPPDVVIEEHSSSEASSEE